MPYKKTFKFLDKTNGQGDELRLKIIFTVDLDGTDIEYNCEDEGIYLSSLPALEWEWDIEDFLLVPGILKIRISESEDSLKHIQTILRGDDPVSLATDRRGEVILEIKYYGTAEFVEELSGIIAIPNKHNPHTTYIEISVIPPTDILNETFLYDDREDPPTNLNPLGYTANNGINQYRSIKTIINDIYNYMGTVTDLEFGHSWVLNGTEVEPHYTSLVFQGWELIDTPELPTDLKLEEIKYSVDELFFNAGGLAAGMSLGDLLKKLAFDWGAITGAISKTKVFFKGVFFDNPIIDITEDNLEDEYTQDEFDLVKSIYIKTESYYTSGGDIRYTKAKTSRKSKFLRNNIEAETLSEVHNEIIGAPVVMTTPIIAERNPSSHVKVNYFVSRYSNNPIGTGKIFTTQHPARLLNTLSQLRNARERTVIRYFKLTGINYSFLNDFRYKGKLYFPLKLKKCDLLKGDYTEVICLPKPVTV